MVFIGCASYTSELAYYKTILAHSMQADLHNKLQARKNPHGGGL